MKATVSSLALVWLGTPGGATTPGASGRSPDTTEWFCKEDAAAAHDDPSWLSSTLLVPFRGESRARFLPFERLAGAAGALSFS